MTAITGIEVHMNEHPRTYSRVTREALTMMGGLIRLARKQRKMSEADLAARVGIARSTLYVKLAAIKGGYGGLALARDDPGRSAGPLPVASR